MNQRDLKPCQECGVPVRQDRLLKHLKHVHPNVKVSLPFSAETLSPADQQVPKKNKRKFKFKKVKPGVSGIKKPKKKPPTDREMQEFFENNMQSAGRFGSSRRH